MMDATNYRGRPIIPSLPCIAVDRGQGIARSYPMRVAPLGPRRQLRTPAREGRNDMIPSSCRFDHHGQNSPPPRSRIFSLSLFSASHRSLGSRYHSATPITSKQSIYIQGQATGSYSIGRWTSNYRHQIFSESATSRLDRSS